jgi:D-alanyl-D-alanine carboxypeptidase
LKKIVSFWIGIIVSATGFCATTTNLTQNANQFLKTTQKTYGVSAASLSIYYPNGQIQTLTGSQPYQSDNVKLDSNHLFRMNSITKSFTAALVLRLVDNGQINLDDRLTKYLPQYTAWKEITVRELLNQTSGIFDYIDSPNWFENLAKNPTKDWMSAQLVQIAYEHLSYFSPGKGWSYSNTNYVLLGILIEHVTKMSMAENLQTQFFTPLHLNHTFYVPGKVPKSVLNQLVHGYFQGVDATNENPSVWQAAAGVISNTHDMAIWFHGLMTGKVLSQKSLQLMETLVSTQNGKPISMANVTGMAYGMGVFYSNAPGPLWFVPGISSGYRSLVVYDPKQNTTYALAVNSGLPNEPHFVDQMLIGLTAVANRPVINHSLLH